MRKHLIVVLLLLVLSAYAEGQAEAVKIKPVQEGEVGLPVAYADMNSRWVAYTWGDTILVHDRSVPWQNIPWHDLPIPPLWLDNGTIYPQGIVNVILNGNYLIVAGDGYSHIGGIVGIWDLLNIVDEEVQRSGHVTYNPSMMVHPQNIRIDHQRLKYIFVNKIYNHIGIYDKFGYVTVYEMFGGNSVLQTFYVGDDALSLAFCDNFFVIGKKMEVDIYYYNSSNRYYESAGTYRWEGGTYTGSIEFKYADKGRLGITVTDKHVYILANTNTSKLEIICLSKNKPKKMISRVVMNCFDMSGIYDVDCEYAVIGEKIFHIPSARVMGSFDPFNNNNVYMNVRCINGQADHFEMTMFGVTYTDPSHWYYYYSEFDEPIFSISSPKVTIGGIVKLVTSPRVFLGGNATFVATADERMKVKYIIDTGSSKKMIRKETASLLYKYKNISKNVGLKKIGFAETDMKKYKIFLPYSRVLGRSIASGDNPRKWYYYLSAGKYVCYSKSPYDGAIGYYILIVKSDGTHTTAPLK